MYPRREIESILKNKNIPTNRIEYVRGCPTPSGYANGWCVDISEDTETRIQELGGKCEMYMEFDTLAEVLKWANGLPVLTP